MIENNVKQIRMSNGDELLCEILEELDEDLVVRYCLTIEKISNNDDKKVSTFYIMRPWMTYIEKTDEIITLSKYHCMAYAQPNNELLEQYGSALKTIIELGDEESDKSEIDVLLTSGMTAEENAENVVQITSLLKHTKNKLH